MRYYGAIGFGPTKPKDGDDIWVEDITERPYYGDVPKHVYAMRSGDKLTKDVQMNIQISIIADEFALQFMHLIRYAEWRGEKWEVTSVDPSQRPRLILSLGGVYNG